ncbi:30S ribosomal protein S16 [Marinoscillum sp. 108]|uniref:30S ribosomal protein S16 n=1 Tax=Marinoscillum sp. 108 TaxID=2653151 RepID=UPI0012F03222|nr:30S ribosomal protein S16 [Marinoscillum sp. 108]VXD19724.1 30S ribosomal protein S16 [Marinoscillum sp. 108]
MPVKIRLSRRGRKKQAMYDVVVADSRAPRDGKFIEKIGTYNPNTDPASISLNDEKAFDWVMKGAQPTDTVKAMLSYRGIMMKKHLQIGVLKGAITQEDADKKFEIWLAEKEAKIQGKVEKLSATKASEAKARLAAEKKVSDARAEAIAAKKKVADDTLVAEIAEAGADEAEKALEEEGNEAVAAVETPAAEEAPAAEAPAEEAPKAEEPKAEAPEEAAPAADEEKKED